MAKTLEEAYRQVVEASVLPNPANLKKPGIGAGSGQHSVGNMSVQTKSLAQAAADTGSYSAQAAINRTQIKPKVDSPIAKPNKPSAPGSVNAATGGANPTDAQRRAGMSVTNVRDSMYGSNPTAKAKAGPTTNTGASGAGPVPSVERPRQAAPVPNKGMKGSPLDQTQGAKSSVSQQYRLNKLRQDSKTGTNASLEKSYNAKAGTSPRDSALDQPNSQSPMARATNPNVGGAGGVGSSFGKKEGSGTTIKPRPKPGQAQAAPTGNPNPKTSGTPAVPGNANIKPSAKPDFKQAYAAARKTGQTNFEWNGKKYNTNMKGETSAKRNQVLARNKQRTAGKAARSGSLMEMIKNICREKAQPLLEYQARSRPTGGYIGAKVPNARMSMHDKMSLPLSGKDVSKRYTLSTVVEAEKEIDDANLEKKKKRSKETLNTEPQQSDEKIF